MGIFLSCRNDDGLDIRCKFTVRIRNRPLGLKINHVPDPTHNVPDAELPTLINSQIVILDNADTF